ncbi:hypothetical protein ACTXT7_013913 [Hymenolepis weldensis]
MLFIRASDANQNRLMRAKQLFNKLKRPEEKECLWFFSDGVNFHQDEKSIQEMIGSYVRTDPTEVTTVIRTKFPETVMFFSAVSNERHIMTPPFFPLDLRVKIDANAYVRTILTIVKPPWIGSVANGGRLYAFQQDKAPSHKALKIQDYMDFHLHENFHHHIAKLVAATYFTKP